MCSFHPSFLTISGRPGLLDPVREVTHEVEEEVPLRDRDDFVGDLDEEAETLARPQVEPLRDALAEVLGPRRGVNLEGLRSEK